jgi:hypothetical protein
MKTRLLLSITVIILFLSSLHAQENEIKFGLGISLNPIAILSTSTQSTLFLPIGLTNIYAPVTFNKKYRVEPEMGIYSSSSETTSGSSTSKNSSTLLRLGLGLQIIKSFDDVFNASFGFRFGILSISSTASYTGSKETTSNETDYYIGLAVGGEHMLSQHFGIGGELQLNYVRFGQPSNTSGSKTQNMFTNNALMFLRWYY